MSRRNKLVNKQLRVNHSALDEWPRGANRVIEFPRRQPKSEEGKFSQKVRTFNAAQLRTRVSRYSRAVSLLSRKHAKFVALAAAYPTNRDFPRELKLIELALGANLGLLEVIRSEYASRIARKSVV